MLPGGTAGGTYTITAVYGGTGDFQSSSGTATLFINTPPGITAGATITRQQGSAGVAVASLVVIATGLSVTSITNTTGTITANVAAGCNATVGANTVVLTVSDGSAATTANLTVNVTANTAPVLGAYANTSVTIGDNATITPGAAPGDNGTIVSLTVTASAGFTGTITFNSQGIVTITNAGPTGNYTITISATDNCGAKATATFALTVDPVAYEADTVPRPNGNGNGEVTISDWVQVGRFAVGLDTLNPGSEFQRADCAPLATFGDGKITLLDWVQAGRYVVGLDPINKAAGPTASVPTALATIANEPFFTEATRTVRVLNGNFQRGQINSLAVELDAQGNENALSFSWNFDPKLLSFYTATTPAGMNLTINQKLATQGKVGFMLALPAEQFFPTGTRTLLHVQFIPNGGGGNETTTIAVFKWMRPVKRSGTVRRAVASWSAVRREPARYRSSYCTGRTHPQTAIVVSATRSSPARSATFMLPAYRRLPLREQPSA